MKRFYCTDKRGQEVVESDTTIIDTDERVANFFTGVPTPEKGIGYKRDFDINGLPILVSYVVNVEDNFYSKYLDVPDVDGIYQPDVTTIQSRTEKALIAHFKVLYLKVISDKLEVLKYDSLTTVKLWEGDADFGTEASKILNWYKNIINKNILIEDTVKAGEKFKTAWVNVIPTDDEYLAEINAIVF